MELPILICRKRIQKKCSRTISILVLNIFNDLAFPGILHRELQRLMTVWRNTFLPPSYARNSAFWNYALNSRCSPPSMSSEYLLCLAALESIIFQEVYLSFFWTPFTIWQPLHSRNQPNESSPNCLRQSSLRDILNFHSLPPRKLVSITQSYFGRTSQIHNLKVLQHRCMGTSPLILEI